ncbi:SsgA family sporulation/cell division regulator [Streptomyces sp. NPDC102381]|uniref:SsgA family sporulation/cell division regulator n=1 Tax=Streptomyces sp. NPDC102381 TaxID=3366164 RepID=UPI00382ED00B
MHNTDVTDDDFDTLLNASSLGAPHVLAEREPIPAKIRHRLAHAAAARPHPHEGDQAPQTCHTPTKHMALWMMDTDTYRPRLADHTDGEARYGHVVATTGSGKSLCMGALTARLALAAPPPVISFDQAALDRTRALYQDLRCALAELTTRAQELGAVRELLSARYRAAQRRHGSVEDLLGALSRLAGCAHASPARRAETTPQRLPWEQTVTRARMTELLTPLDESIRDTPTFRFRHQTVHAPAWTTALDGQEQRRELCAAARTLLDVTPTVHAGLPQLHFDAAQRLGRMLRSDTWSSSQRSTTAVRQSQAAAHQAWPQGLLLVNHLPVLWHPSDTPPSLAYSGTGRMRTSAESGGGEIRGQDSRTAQRRGEPMPTMQVETDEQGPALHTRLQMALHEEEGDGGTPVAARLTYRLSDPYAVEVTFHPDETEPVVWAIARDLMTEGLSHSAGEGDVIVWTTAKADPEQKQRTYIRLNAPEGTALLSAPFQHLRRYLERTQSLCSPGMERPHVGAALVALEAELSEPTCRGFSE